MFHLGDIDLAHLHHCLHCAVGAVRVGVGDQLEQAAYGTEGVTKKCLPDEDLKLELCLVAQGN